MTNNDPEIAAVDSPSSPRRRDSGHYLLLLLAIVFFAEEFVFLLSALHNAGRQQGTAARFLVLTIGVFLTAVAALYGFARRISFTVGVFFGLLLIQPAITALANLIGGAPQKSAAVAFAAGASGVLLLSTAIVRNRSASRTSRES